MQNCYQFVTVVSVDSFSKLGRKLEMEGENGHNLRFKESTN